MKEKKYGRLALSVAAALAAGGLSYLLTGRDAMEHYSLLNQPPLAPPAAVFPIAWTVLYTLMGVSAWRVWRKDGRVPDIYWIQLALNVIWTPIFFRFGLYWAAFAVLAVLEAAILRMIGRFRESDRPAGNLQIPYALWVVFAGYLNVMTAILN